MFEGLFLGILGCCQVLARSYKSAQEGSVCHSFRLFGVLHKGPSWVWWFMAYENTKIRVYP